jgi:hypothetical protein
MVGVRLAGVEACWTGGGSGWVEVGEGLARAGAERRTALAEAAAEGQWGVRELESRDHKRKRHVVEE